MNIKVEMEDPHASYADGGESAACTLEITLDANLSFDMKVERVIHAIAENYCRSWGHDKVEELTELIMQGLEQIGIRE